MNVKLPVKESDIQTALFQWAEMQSNTYPALRLMYHCPNGGSRNIAEAKNLKAQGVKAGVPDIFLPVARNGFHGAYIELKSGKNTLSDNQALWINDLIEEGYCCFVAYDWQIASKFLIEYLKEQDTPKAINRLLRYRELKSGEIVHELVLYDAGGTNKAVKVDKDFQIKHINRYQVDC